MLKRLRDRLFAKRQRRQYTVYLPDARRKRREPFDPHTQGHGGWFWDEKDFSYIHHGSGKRVIWEEAISSRVVLINGWLVQEL